ncbi:hypothetical protein ACFL6U_30645 [Planctomycetota bacterium]
MYIKNIGTTGEVRVIGLGDATSLKVAPHPSPSRRVWTTVPLDDPLEAHLELLELQPGEEIKLYLPESIPLELRLKLNQEDCIILFQEDSGLICHEVGI